MMAAARNYFAKKNVLEVDCPSLLRYPQIDTNIDVMSVSVSEKDAGFLHTSPEYSMKRLIAAGSQDIYQIAHVFRKGELGSLHNPEFTMVEWYRLGVDYLAFIEETCEFIRLFLGDLPSQLLSYEDAFQNYLGISTSETNENLVACIGKHGIVVPSLDASWDHDTLLNILLSHIIEPNLGQNDLLVLYDYPKTQAALSRTYLKKGREVAKRFEIYHQGLELANGFHELTSSLELRERFAKENKARTAASKDPYPLDDAFLDALDNLPDCCGVSAGFDRLMMLRHKKKSIKEVLSFAWE